jgi:hypothetical protein
MKVTIPKDEPSESGRVHGQLCMAINHYLRRKPEKQVIIPELVKMSETFGAHMDDVRYMKVAYSLPHFLRIVTLINDPEFLEILTQYTCFKCLGSEVPEPIKPIEPPTGLAVDLDLDMDYV